MPKVAESRVYHFAQGEIISPYRVSKWDNNCSHMVPETRMVKAYVLLSDGGDWQGACFECIKEAVEASGVSG